MGVVKFPTKRRLDRMERFTIESEMGKRVMLAVVGAGIGALCGLIVDYFGAGTPALWAGAAAGAVIPQFVLGPPGK